MGYEVFDQRASLCVLSLVVRRYLCRVLPTAGIKEAFDDLKKLADDLPKKPCKK